MYVVESCLLLSKSAPFKSMGAGEGNFPGGPVVKSLPTNAGDTGLIPDLGRSHMPAHHNWRKPKCSGEDPKQPKQTDREWKGVL